MPSFRSPSKFPRSKIYDTVLILYISQIANSTFGSKHNVFGIFMLISQELIHTQIILNNFNGLYIYFFIVLFMLLCLSSDLVTFRDAITNFNILRGGEITLY